jgi:hypothetical protein
MNILEPNPRCGGGVSRGEVWIKVCYMKSHWNGGRVYIITLKLESKISWSIAKQYDL